MSLINVPGDELLRVHDALQRVQDLMASGAIRSMGAQVDSLGQRDLRSAARGFEKSWNDGRHMVDKDLRDVRDASKTVADAFQHADDASAAALDDPGPQQPAPQDSSIIDISGVGSGGDLRATASSRTAQTVLDQARTSPVPVTGTSTAQTVLDEARTSPLPPVTGAGR